jgi:hypothetical protein
VSDFQNYFKAKEQTSSSISTLHFGHYKAVCKNDTLSEMHSVFVDFAMNLGFSPKQWKQGLTVMLKKKQGVIKGYVPRTLVWQSLRTQVWPSICFPLVATMISADESESITKVLYSQLLPSGGANRHFPLVYQHAPFTFFGLTLPEVMDTQFIEQVKRVLVHGALPTHTSSYFNISLEQAQLEVGIGSPLLEANYNDYGFLLTFCWVKVLWQFL